MINCCFFYFVLILVASTSSAEVSPHKYSFIFNFMINGYVVNGNWSSPFHRLGIVCKVPHHETHYYDNFDTTRMRVLQSTLLCQGWNLRPITSSGCARFETDN